jgi:hypothetical protein
MYRKSTETTTQQTPSSSSSSPIDTIDGGFDPHSLQEPHGLVPAENAATTDITPFYEINIGELHTTDCASRCCHQQPPSMYRGEGFAIPISSGSEKYVHGRNGSS